MTDLLLMSNSTNHGHGYLEHANAAVREILDGISELVFVPYALADHAAYAAKAAEAFRPLGVAVRGLHTASDPVKAVYGAPAIFTGGGNTFRLLKTLYELDLLEPLRQRALSGMPYLGASAGTNIAAPTVRTTNDMPIVEPPSLDALGLVPFQLNPHYLDPDPGSTHMGETREQRLTEFHECNATAVLGLREGAWLRVTDGTAIVAGNATNGRAPGRIFRRGETAVDVTGDVSDLLRPS
jgi:Peptidase E